ncbi:hypothetical protein F5888DRAFT_1642583 [Russula emetica]|nr:hypothetical protein F5888DRAFT_1642583 [Russula emetica]
MVTFHDHTCIELCTPSGTTLAYDVLEIFPLHPNLSVWAPLCMIQSQIVQRNDWLKEDMAKRRATRSPYSVGQCCEVHLSASEWSDVHPEYICANWLGTVAGIFPSGAVELVRLQAHTPLVSLGVGYAYASTHWAVRDFCPTPFFPGFLCNAGASMTTTSSTFDHVGCAGFGQACLAQFACPKDRCYVSRVFFLPLVCLLLPFTRGAVDYDCFLNIKRWGRYDLRGVLAPFFALVDGPHAPRILTCMCPILQLCWAWLRSTSIGACSKIGVKVVCVTGSQPTYPPIPRGGAWWRALHLLGHLTRSHDTGSWDEASTYASWTGIHVYG